MRQVAFSIKLNKASGTKTNFTPSHRVLLANAMTTKNSINAAYVRSFLTVLATATSLIQFLKS